MSSRLSAFDALARGLTNLRANWELALAQLAALALVSVLTVASLVPIGLAVGLGVADLSGPRPGTLWHLADPSTWFSMEMVIALAVCLVIATMAIGIYAWFQAGIFGLLVAGDRQAGAGPRRPRALFRTFSWPDLAAWGGRGLWRFFAWYQVYLLLATVLLGLYATLFLGAVSLGISQGPVAGIGLGCGGLLPLLFVSLLCSVWFEAAKADLAREGSGPLAAWSRAGRVVARRLGATLLLLVLFVCASIATSMFVLPLQLAAEVGMRNQIGAYLGTQALVMVLQAALGTLLGLAYGAAFVALMRAEIPDPAG